MSKDCENCGAKGTVHGGWFEVNEEEWEGEVEEIPDLVPGTLCFNCFIFVEDL